MTDQRLQGAWYSRGAVEHLLGLGSHRRHRRGRSQSWPGAGYQPVARALMKAHEGDTVKVRAPPGVEQIEVLEIRYRGARGEPQ